MNKLFRSFLNIFLMGLIGSALGVIGGMVIGAFICLLANIMIYLSDAVQHVTNNPGYAPHLRDLMVAGMFFGAFIGGVLGGVFGIKKSDKL